MWIHEDLDPDTAYYLNADADPGKKPMQIHADPDPDQTLKS
jgi:hypothetical protein